MDAETAQRAYGEALYASLTLESVTAALIAKGLLTPSDLEPHLDRNLLFLEEMRAKRTASRLAIDHARSRLENLLRHLGQPPSDQSTEPSV